MKTKLFALSILLGTCSLARASSFAVVTDINGVPHNVPVVDTAEEVAKIDAEYVILESEYQVGLNKISDYARGKDLWESKTNQASLKMQKNRDKRVDLLALPNTEKTPPQPIDPNANPDALPIP